MGISAIIAKTSRLRYEANCVDCVKGNLPLEEARSTGPMACVHLVCSKMIMGSASQRKNVDDHIFDLFQVLQHRDITFNEIVKYE